MADKTLALTVKPRGRKIKKLPASANLPQSQSTADLYNQLASATSYSVHRLRITKEDGSLVASSRDTTLADAGLTDSSVVLVKDLGPQIAWRTVFVVEYLGPLLIHPLIYSARPYLYPLPSLSASSIPPPSQLQLLSMVLCCLHFLKREYETLFVHRFSAATMPARNIVKNSGHYWLFAGLNIAYWTYSPTSIAQKHDSLLWGTDLLTTAGTALFAVAEIANFYTHTVLANLRPAGTTTRGIPRGFSFNWVTCPNYMWEALAWVGVSMVTRSWATVFFLAVSGGQMIQWAGKKERRYRKEFGDKYKKKRFVMLPGVV